jgi:recombination protein RecR
MNSPEIQLLIQHLSKLPGLGPRSGRRVALHLLKKREKIFRPLIQVMLDAEQKVKNCSMCHALDASDPCTFCGDPKRQSQQICVVGDVADLWALERAQTYKGVYHVLGGVLSAIDGIGPQQLAIQSLLDRVAKGGVTEIILALNATVDGQTTIHYLNEQLRPFQVTVTMLAHGVPVGGELDYLDEGTLFTAFQARRIA